MNDHEALYWHWMREGWKYRSQRNPNLARFRDDYAQRVKYESELIVEKDFVSYFLVLSDAVRWCKSNGVAVGPARGSAAASLCLYLLRVTEIDPIQFPTMLFERFIDKNRMDLPDVDLDFDDERRPQLRAYLEKKYGRDNIGSIGTFTKYRGKNSLADVARVYGIPEYEVKKIKDFMVVRSSGDSRVEESLRDTVAMFPQAQEVMNRFPDLEKAYMLEGNYRGMSVHAAGLIISNDPITNICAMYTRETGNGVHKTTRRVLSVDKYDAEHLNLLKMDFLGLSTMGMIRHAIDEIGMDLEDLYALPLDDPNVIDIFASGDLTGIFQFGAGTTRIVTQLVKPVNFMELSDINALSRPGPLQSGQTQDYVGVKEGKKPELVHPVFDEIVSSTKHQVVYQEQVLRIVREVGDFPWTHAAIIRKAISQKWGEATFNTHEGAFIDGAARVHGIDEKTARYIWRKLVTSASYSFNIAHSISYSVIAYWTAWIKAYHPKAFYMGVLAKFPGDTYLLLRDAIKHGIKVVNPHPNNSSLSWRVEGNTLRAGFLQIHGIAERMAEKVLNERDANGPFRGWGDLIRVSGIGPVKVSQVEEQMASEDPFGIYSIDKIIGTVRKDLLNGELPGLPMPTHMGAEIPTGWDDRVERVIYLGVPVALDPRDTVEDERMASGRDYEEIRRGMRRPDLTKRMVIHCQDDSDKLVFVRINRFVYPAFEKAVFGMRLNKDAVLIAGERRSGFGTSLYAKRMWVITPDD